jgi:hypothetical protein
MSADAGRGSQFSLPLSPDELAICDAVAENESGVAPHLTRVSRPSRGG